MTNTPTPAASVTARPIHFTSQVDRVCDRLTALGLQRVSGAAADGWQVFAAPGAGRIAVHSVAPGSPNDGKSCVGFEVATQADLATLRARLAQSVAAQSPAAGSAELVETDHGTALAITATDGTSFTVDTAGPELPDAATNPTDAPGIEVAQMWFTDKTGAARTILEELGLTELVTTTGLGWVDTRAPGGGRTQIHGAPSARVSVGFVSERPLEEIQARLAAAGDPANIIDESWGRYLALSPVTVDIPETPLDGELTWVNEQKDYYGYQVHADA